MENEFTSTFTSQSGGKQMTESDDIGKFLRCPYCPCIFITEADLQKHMDCMGQNREEHIDCYGRTHARIERGSYATE